MIVIIGISVFVMFVSVAGKDVTGRLSLRKKITIHQVITMQATSKNAIFPGHNYVLTTGADDATL